MHGLEKPVYDQRIRELLERVELNDRRNDYLDTFSGGMQRRVALIRALIHEPKLLFLDEPTTGLDPAARREIWDTIQDLKHNTTVILTTHYMEEADRLSDRITMLNHGAVVMEGTAEELKRHISPPNTYELTLTVPRASDYQQILRDWVEGASVIDAEALRFQLRRPEDLTAVMARIAPSDLKSLGLAEADLETVYLMVAGQKMPLSSVGAARPTQEPSA
jgi:ABC-2 type transport system ATP-binding protein